MDSRLSRAKALSKFTTQKANGSRVDYADDAVEIAVSIVGSWWQLRRTHPGRHEAGALSELATFHTRSAGMPCVWCLCLCICICTFAACHCICLSLKCKKGFQHFPPLLPPAFSDFSFRCLSAKCCHPHLFLFLLRPLTTFKRINSTALLETPHPGS